MFMWIEKLVLSALRALRTGPVPRPFGFAARIAPGGVLLACSLLIGMAMLHLVIATTLWLGGSIQTWHFPTFLLVVFATLYLSCRGARTSFPVFLIIALLAAVLIAAAFVLGGQAFDQSADGQTSHRIAIVHLANQWNPIYDEYFEHTPPNYVLGDYTGAKLHGSYIVLNAAKGVYYQSAAAYRFFGSINAGIGFNFITMAAAFFLVLAAASKLLPRAPGIALSVALVSALSPIAINQALSNYVDGQLGMILTSFIALAVLLAVSTSRLQIAAFGAVVLLAIDAKLTGFFFIGALGVFALALLRWKTGEYRGAGVFVAAVIAGFCFVGITPYVRNLTEHGNLTAYIQPGMVWQNHFVDQYDRATKLAISLFSETSLNPSVPVLKPPFLITHDEWHDYHGVADPDARIGGFGPWMGGIVFLTIVTLLLTVVRKTPGRWMLLIVVAGILVSVLAHPEAWWARWVPQFWMLPICVAVFAIGAQDRRDLFVLGRLLLAAIAFDVAFVTTRSVSLQATSQWAAEAVVQAMQIYPGVLDVYFENFTPNRLLLQRRGIPYREIRSTDGCQATIRPMAIRLSVCVRANPSPDMQHMVERVQRIQEKIQRKRGISFALIGDG